MYCLVAHCPTPGCYMRVQVCTLSSEEAPRFSANLSVNVLCPSCGQEFREPASLLEHSLQSSVTGKFRIAPRG